MTMPQPMAILSASLLDALGEGVIGLDRASRIVYTNPAARRILGLGEDDLLGCPLEQAVPFPGEDSHPACGSVVRKALAEGGSYGPVTGCRLTLAGTIREMDFLLLPAGGEHMLLLFQPSTHGGSDSLLQRAIYDSLTALPNRAAIQQTLEHMDRESRRLARPFTLLLIDIDRFRLFNDSYGQATGDTLLSHVARTARAALRPTDVLGRWGGQELLALLPDTPLAEGLRVAEQVRAALAAHPVPAPGGRELMVTASIGAAAYPVDDEGVDDLLGRADLALTEAKRQGRNRVYAIPAGGSARLAVAAQLDEALQQQRIHPAYQPIVDVRSGAVVAEEALARIVTPDGQVMVAAQFIDAAEQLQLAHRIDFALTRTTILRCRHQAETGVPTIAHFVNISADLLRHPALVEELQQIVTDTCTACYPEAGSQKPLVIEITERELLDNVAEAERLLRPFLDLGLRLAIDDFGSGYSSLQYLADLPVSFLKVEGSLVRRAPDEPRVRAILRGVQDLAGELGLVTIAECVENERILATVRELGMDWAQGRHFGAPVLD